MAAFLVMCLFALMAFTMCILIVIFGVPFKDNHEKKPKTWGDFFFR